jgi:hypothetical protein
MALPSVENETLSSGLLALFSGDGKRLVVVMEAFVDESGTHRGSPIVSVAAWAGAQWQWKKFLSHWGHKSFHARKPQYAPLKHGLFQAIEFGELEGFTAWMNPSDYNIHTAQQFRNVMGNAYAMCAYACAIGVCRFARKKKLGKVAFIIEDGQPNIDFVREVLEHMKAKEHFGIASVATASKKDFVQLCTADFLAHSRTSDEEWFERLDDTGRISVARITPHALGKMSEDVTQNLEKMRHQKLLLKKQRKVIKSQNDANAKDKAAQ